MSNFLFVLNISFDKPGPSVHLLQDVLGATLEGDHTIDVILKRENDQAVILPEKLANNDRIQFYYIDEFANRKAGFVKRYLQEILYARKCGRILNKRKKYDAVFLQSCNTGLFFILSIKKAKCPIIFNVQDIFPYNLKMSEQLPLNKLLFPIFRTLQNLAYNKAKKIITISEDMKDTLINDGVPQEKIEVIYNWSYADSKIFVEDIKEQDFYDLKMNNEKFNIVYAGNIGKMQNVEIIALAARECKDDSDIHFYIIGDGANKDRILHMVTGLENVTVLPMQESRYAESIYAQADVNIIPLAKGGIFTALPSKTATCLRVQKPLVFCIDKTSKFQSVVKENEMLRYADCTNHKSLCEQIYILKEEKKNVSELNYTLFKNLFSRNNAQLYRKVMESVSESI